MGLLNCNKSYSFDGELDENMKGKILDAAIEEFKQSGISANECNGEVNASNIKTVFFNSKAKITVGEYKGTITVRNDAFLMPGIPGMVIAAVGLVFLLIGLFKEINDINEFTMCIVLMSFGSSMIAACVALFFSGMEFAKQKIEQITTGIASRIK